MVLCHGKRVLHRLSLEDRHTHDVALRTLNAFVAHSHPVGQWSARINESTSEPVCPVDPRLKTEGGFLWGISSSATYLNFLASHDGIGMRPVEGLLSAAQRRALVDRVLANGGQVSMKTNPDGSQDVYELNISYLDALATTLELSRPDVVSAKALAAHAVLLSLMGIPAIYYHSFFGSPGDPEAARTSGIARRINRAHIDEAELDRQLQSDLRRRTVLEGLRRLLETRRHHSAFSPYSAHCVERLDDRVFAVRRGRGTLDEVLCLINVTNQSVVLPHVGGTDLLTGGEHRPLTLDPYGYVWLAGS